MKKRFPTNSLSVSSVRLKLGFLPVSYAVTTLPCISGVALLKTLLSDDGEIELSTPRDRENTLEPQLIRKNQTRITQIDSQIYPCTPKA